MAKKSLVERMDKFLGGAILEASANFDNDFTGLGKDLGDCNKTLSDQNWNQRLREIDAANQSKLQEKNDKLLELIRKANVIFASSSCFFLSISKYSLLKYLSYTIFRKVLVRIRFNVLSSTSKTWSAQLAIR